MYFSPSRAACSPTTSSTATPEWETYWQIIVMICAGEIAFAAANLFRPEWTLPRIFLRVAIDLAKTAADVWLLASDVLREFVVQGVDAGAVENLYRLSALAARFAQPIGVLIGLAVVVTAVRRIWVVMRSGRHSPA
jgi:hypothetical protein